MFFIVYQVHCTIWSLEELGVMYVLTDFLAFSLGSGSFFSISGIIMEY